GCGQGREFGGVLFRSDADRPGVEPVEAADRRPPPLALPLGHRPSSTLGYCQLFSCLCQLLPLLPGRGRLDPRARSMHRSPVLRFVSAALLALLASSARADLPEIARRGTLRALVVLDLDGRAVAKRRADSPGFDDEILDGFARIRHLKLEIVPVDGWDKLIPALVDDKGDVIAGSFTVTDERRKLIDFTDEVVPTRSVVVTRRPHRAVTTLDELRNE